MFCFVLLLFWLCLEVADIVPLPIPTRCQGFLEVGVVRVLSVFAGLATKFCPPLSFLLMPPGVSSGLRRGTSPLLESTPLPFQAKNTWKAPQAVTRPEQERKGTGGCQKSSQAAHTCFQFLCPAFLWRSSSSGGRRLEGEAKPCSHPCPDPAASSQLQLDPGAFCIGSGLQSKGWAWVSCPSPLR